MIKRLIFKCQKNINNGFIKLQHKTLNKIISRKCKSQQVAVVETAAIRVKVTTVKRTECPLNRKSIIEDKMDKKLLQKRSPNNRNNSPFNRTFIHNLHSCKNKAKNKSQKNRMDKMNKRFTLKNLIIMAITDLLIMVILRKKL